MRERSLGSIIMLAIAAATGISVSIVATSAQGPVGAGCSKFPERPVKPTAELEFHAISGRNPNFCNPNEGRHPGLQSLGICPDRNNVLSILAHASPPRLCKLSAG
jgi:hypothetical protein